MKLASILFMLWSIKYHKVVECLTDWRDLWVDEAFWHLLFSVVLLVIMVLWRPSQNHQRAMSGYPRIDAPSRMVKQQDDLYDLWWDVWKKERLADFIPQPNKWRSNSESIKVGDIVAFVKEETGDVHGRPIYKVGRVTAVEHSVDGLVRTCSIQYKNAANPTLFHDTRMSVRHVAVIHSENDLDLVQQLNAAAKAAEELYIAMYNAG